VTTPQTIPNQTKAAKTAGSQLSPATPGTRTANSSSSATSTAATSTAATTTPNGAYALPVAITDPKAVTGFYSTSYVPGKQHLGVDLPAASSTPVNSPVTGSIVQSYNRGTDSFVVLQQNGTTTQQVLGHVACYGCYPGEPVTKGQPFGAQVINNPSKGAEGGGDHVHWGANYQGVPVQAKDGWGWGAAPATSTAAEASGRGWFNPLSGP
jgi:murein DD-endopeptidase MepM/ murein hydrolase activator NlpD